MGKGPWKTLLLPFGLFSAQMKPSCISTIRLQMVRPSPASTDLPHKTCIHPMNTIDKALITFERYTQPIMAHKHLQHLPITVH
jgi:hypothetical protein